MTASHPAPRLMKSLINRRHARALFMAAAKEWDRPLARPPIGFYKELDAALRLKIQSEAAHPANNRAPKS